MTLFYFLTLTYVLKHLPNCFAWIFLVLFLIDYLFSMRIKYIIFLYHLDLPIGWVENSLPKCIISIDIVWTTIIIFNCNITKCCSIINLRVCRCKGILFGRLRSLLTFLLMSESFQESQSASWTLYFLATKLRVAIIWSALALVIIQVGSTWCLMALFPTQNVCLNIITMCLWIIEILLLRLEGSHVWIRSVVLK